MTFQLDTMTLGLKYVDLGASAGYMLQQNIKNGKLYLKSSTWMNSNNTIPAGSSGSIILPLSVRNTSLNHFLQLSDLRQFQRLNLHIYMVH